MLYVSEYSVKSNLPSVYIVKSWCFLLNIHLKEAKGQLRGRICLQNHFQLDLIRIMICSAPFSSEQWRAKRVVSREYSRPLTITYLSPGIINSPCLSPFLSQKIISLLIPPLAVGLN